MSSTGKFTQFYDNNNSSIQSKEKQTILSSKGILGSSHSHSNLTGQIENRNDNNIEAKKNILKQFYIQLNEKPPDELKEINVLKMRLEQHKLFYEEGKKAWLEDIEHMHRCICILKQHMKKNSINLQCWLNKAVNQLQETMNYLDDALNDEFLIKQAAILKNVKIINYLLNAKTKLSYLTEEINSYQLIASEAENERVFQTLDLSIKSAILRAEKSIISKKLATEPSKLKDSKKNSNSSAYQYLLNDTVIFEENGHYMSLNKNQNISLSPPKLKTIIENNLIQSTQIMMQKIPQDDPNSNQGTTKTIATKQEPKKISLNSENQIIKKINILNEMKQIDYLSKQTNTNFSENLDTPNWNYDNTEVNKTNLVDFEEESFAKSRLKRIEDTPNPFKDIDSISPGFSNEITNLKNNEIQDNSFFSQRISPRFGGLNDTINSNGNSNGNTNYNSNDQKNEGLISNDNQDLYFQYSTSGMMKINEKAIKMKGKKNCGCLGL